MKIDPNLTIGNVTSQGTHKHAGKKGVFENMLSGLEQTTAAPEAAGVQATMAAPPTLISPAKLQGLGMSEQAIELLDGYANALSDPAVSLKALKPMVDEMAGLKASLDKTASALSDDDPLKGVLKDVGSTIESEVLRFNRGDLLA